jgi:transcriptional regulator with XRE-family HTH domain
MMCCMTESDDWQRLARHARDRRGDLGLTQAEAAAAGGLSISTLRLIEGGRQAGYRPAILRALERGLQWERGSVRAILAGGGPVPAGEDEPTLPGIPPASAPADEMARVGAEKFADEMYALAAGIRGEIDGARREGTPENRIFENPSEQDVWSGAGLPPPEDQRILAIAWLRAVRLRAARPGRPAAGDADPPAELAG